jgi:hypothetical protein
VGINFTTKDCPSAVKAALEHSARVNRRSQNAEAIVPNLAVGLQDFIASAPQ